MAPANNEPPLVARSPLHPMRSTEDAAEGSVIVAAKENASAPSRNAESLYCEAEGAYVIAIWCQVESHAGRRGGSVINRMRLWRASLIAITRPEGIKATPNGRSKPADVPVPSENVP